jgi:hypothetical protein
MKLKTKRQSKNKAAKDVEGKNKSKTIKKEKYKNCKIEK